MSAPLDWGHAYERTQRDTVQRLRDMRSAGVAHYTFGDGSPSDLAPCDPSRMSDRAIATSARLHAERTVQRAINLQSAQAER